MHNFLYTFFIALTNNVDNIGVRIAYSIRGIRISTRINLWIAAITFVISYCAALSGTMISGFISKQLSSQLAMLLLSGIGSWMIIEIIIKRRGSHTGDRDDGKEENTPLHVLLNPQDADMDNSKHIDFREATLLGIALSLNNVGGGVSAGMIGLDSFWVGLLSAALSFIALWAGNYVSEFFVRFDLSDKATVASGLILIAIGVYPML